MNNFSALNLRQALLDNLSTLNYKCMTPIQAQSLPIMLNNQDVIAQAKTGSGKTAAFGLSVLNRIQIEIFTVQALVLCPTRELAEQVTQALRQLARLMPNVKILNLSGGMPMKPQTESLKHGAHIIVGTPGRIFRHIEIASLSLKKLQILVLDEADRMLDMGFFDDIRDIVTRCPKQRQTLLFSATFPEEIKELAQQFMKSPETIKIVEENVELDIEQIFYEINHKTNKFTLLKSILLHYQPVSTLVFCNTKDQAHEIALKLEDFGFSVLVLSGDMEQRERDLTLLRFKHQSASILVATDVAARGLDIKELPLVINYDLAFNSDTHVHRIGRTGRAGKKGLAISFVTSADAERLMPIEESLKDPIIWGRASELDKTANALLLPEMVTLCLFAGKKDKLRPGDILGALTKDAGIPGDKIGKIDISLVSSYVAVHQSQADKAYDYLRHGKIKGRKINLKVLK